MVAGRLKWSRAACWYGADRRVFVDESAIRTDFVPTSGDAPRNERLVDVVPGSHKTISIISAIRTSGVVATQAVTRPINGFTFWTWVTEFLTPNLWRGDSVVLDNLRVHSDRRALIAIDRAGAKTRFLPPYSPDLNPIEEMWSKVKGIVRKNRPRNFVEVCQSLTHAIDAVRQSDLRGWFQHAYYSFFS